MSRIIPLEHMLAAIAYKVADHVNEHTRFGEAASTILNNAALVQMYTDTADSKDTITVTKLTAVYPSQTVTGVLLDATKAYMSTQGKGNFTFKILKNGAQAQDVNDIDGMDSIEGDEEPADLSTDDLNAVTQKSRLTGPGVRAAKAPAPKKDVATTGRELRRSF